MKLNSLIVFYIFVIIIIVKNMKKLIFILLLSSVVAPIFSQSTSPYKLNWKTDGSIAAYTTLSTATFLYINSKVKPLTSAQIAELDAQSINSFDRNTTKNYKPSVDKLSDYSVAGACFITAGLSGLTALQATNNNSDFYKQAGTLALMCAEVNMVNALTTNIVKSSVLRTRPYVYNSDVPLDDKSSIHARKSFFSSHTSVTAANSFFMAKVVSDYYPQTWASYSAWGVAAILPAAIGYMRVNAGRHFPTDVITGYVFGGACGILIPYLHKNKTESSQVSVGMGANMISFKVGF